MLQLHRQGSSAHACMMDTGGGGLLSFVRTADGTGRIRAAQRSFRHNEAHQETSAHITTREKRPDRIGELVPSCPRASLTWRGIVMS